MAKVQTTRVYAEIEKAVGNGYPVVSAQGSSRSSKTYNIVIWLIVRCLRVPGTTVSIVRQTLPALKRSVYRDFEENMVNMGIWDQKCMNKSDFMYRFPNGSWLEFFSADNEQKLRGSKRAILYVNEGNELTFLEWQQLQMRTTEFTIIDYNPSFSEDHWISTTVNIDPKTYHFISTYKDNPFLEQKVVDEIESLQWKNPSLWRVYGLGLQAVIEGIVFENVEYIDEIPRWVTEKTCGFVGMDFGYSSDPTAIENVWLYDNGIYIDEVAYGTKMLTAAIVEALRENNRKNKREFKIISESADPRMIDEIYNEGLDIHPVRKFPGSVLAGVQKMQGMKIYVTKRSTNVMREFKNYTYRQDKEGKWLNEPVDAWNHSIDGIRYVILEEVLGQNGDYLGLDDVLGMLP